MEIFSGCGQIYNEARPVLQINSWLFKLSCSRRIHFCCPFHVLIICPGAERLTTLRSWNGPRSMTLSPCQGPKYGQRIFHFAQFSDLIIRPGILYALKQVMRLRERALCWLGIPCSLLVFMSIATSKRGLKGHSILGDESLPCVQKSNLQLSRSALLALLCIVRRVFWSVEQPSTSKLPHVDYFANVLNDCHSDILCSIAVA